MANDLQATNKNTPQNVIKDVNVQKMIQERLGKRAGQFTTSLLAIVNNNKMIAECKPMTIIQAALTAAALDLPINQNLGFAYIVPYDNKKAGYKEAQFQMGWKGFVQLAQRSGQFKTIDTGAVYEGDTDETILRRLTSIIAPAPPSDTVIGYVAYFELLNGFRKSFYMSREDIDAHASRFSQAYRSRGRSSFKSPWETDFDAMAIKTVLKQLLSKYAPLSTEMSEAIAADQSADDGAGRRYVDNDSLDGERATNSERAAIIAANKANEDQPAPSEPEGYSDAPIDIDQALDDATPVSDADLENIDNIFGGKTTKGKK